MPQQHQRAYSSDVAFSPAVKRVQTERGSRAAYAGVERRGGFRVDVDDDLRELLAGIDTAYLATASAEGQPYIQHRGGRRGFIRVVDERRVAFVDYAGNRQYISTGNISENARVCLFLMDYERKQRVKIWGRAQTLPLTALDVVPGLRPALTEEIERAPVRVEQLVVIEVDAWDVNCPAHIPQKLDAAAVADVVVSLRERIAALETENAKLRAAVPR